MNTPVRSFLRLARSVRLSRRAGERRGYAIESERPSYSKIKLSHPNTSNEESDSTNAMREWQTFYAGKGAGGHMPYVKTNPTPSIPHKVVLHNGQIAVQKYERPPEPLPLFWLRDHCQCSQCVHPTTKQRLVETFVDIPERVKSSSVIEEGDSFKVVWEDGHESIYTKSFLSSPRGLNQKLEGRQGWIAPKFWTGDSIRESPPTVDYEAVMSGDSGLKQWLSLIREYGFCYVENTPVLPEATEKLLERIAYIRNTHYGDFWDFTADLSKGDTAYTQLGIGPHTDNTYFSEPAGLQLFHLLEHTDGEGGASQLVDGFNAALQLRQEERRDYYNLSTIKVYSHASGNEDSSIQPCQSFPVLVHDQGTGALLQVRWNNYDRASVDCSVSQLHYWYRAARKWDDILRKNSYWEQLVPGKALIFDNWRVLHGRSAFTGKRRMCGGYINRDDFISRFKMLNYGREEVLRRVSIP